MIINGKYDRVVVPTVKGVHLLVMRGHDVKLQTFRSTYDVNSVSQVESLTSGNFYFVML